MSGIVSLCLRLLVTEDQFDTGASGERPVLMGMSAYPPPCIVRLR